MGSHALHADGLYYESGDKLWVNLYAPSTAEWKSAGVKLDVVTGLPSGETVTFKVTPQTAKKFTLALRRPSWAGDGFHVNVNGRVFKTTPVNSYVEIERTWKAGDTVELFLPKTLRTEALADNPNRFAVMWGPLVLAGDLGPEAKRDQTRTAGAEGPVFATPERLSDLLQQTPPKPATLPPTRPRPNQQLHFLPL